MFDLTNAVDIKIQFVTDVETDNHVVLLVAKTKNFEMAQKLMNDLNNAVLKGSQPSIETSRFDPDGLLTSTPITKQSN